MSAAMEEGVKFMAVPRIVDCCSREWYRR
jgi:hypothetical protein